MSQPHPKSLSVTHARGCLEPLDVCAWGHHYWQKTWCKCCLALVGRSARPKVRLGTRAPRKAETECFVCVCATDAVAEETYGRAPCKPVRCRSTREGRFRFLDTIFINHQILLITCFGEALAQRARGRVGDEYTPRSLWSKIFYSSVANI